MILSPPLIPDADSARQQAEEELARGIYHQETGLWDAFVDWLHGLLDQLEMGNSYLGIPGPVVWALLVGAAIGLVFTLISSRSFRSQARTDRPSSTLFENDLPAAKLRSLANDAAARGDWKTAVLERFRSLIRELDERLIIEEYPGLTAHAAAQLAANALPPLGPQFVAASRIFDDVVYGDLIALPEHDQQLRALERAVLQLPAAFREAE